MKLYVLNVYSSKHLGCLHKPICLVEDGLTETILKKARDKR